MEANPDVLKYADIAAGHGYNIPRIPYEFPIVPYDKAVDQGLKVWLTEISSALDNYDGSMDNAIHWAEVFHKYLTNAHVNAVSSNWNKATSRFRNGSIRMAITRAT